MRRVAACIAVCASACVAYGPETPTVEPSNDGDVIAAFASCMTIENFVASNMGESWRRTKVAGGGDCASCHGEGAAAGVALWPGGLSDDNFFTAIRQHRDSLLVFFQPTPDGRIIVDTEGITALNKNGAHPSYDPSAGITATTQFGEATMQRLLAAGGPCGADPLLD